ncbi:MAG: LysR family transcriptional regulator [Rhodospirillales bacterium]|nr:LysR family transcriptional regulator [Rhodospirillales bacterium]
MSQRRLLPSTSMLAAFDAAARTGSFTAAAKTLDLSQGAISRQIRALEQQLGQDLFVRDKQSVSLTEIGQTYATEIHAALNTIRSASLSVMTNPYSGELKLAILPTFGTRWLIPRLPSFLDSNPGVTVNFFMKVDPFDFAEEGLHAAIHYGLPDWPEADCTFLMGEDVSPVCSPQFRETYGLEKAEDFLDISLLHITTRGNAWSEWFRSCGINNEAHQGMHFEQFSSVAQAAVAGLGAALLPTFLIRSELDSGTLVHALDIPVESSRAYYLAVPHARKAYPPAVAFGEWLVKEIKSHYQR